MQSCSSQSEPVAKQIVSGAVVIVLLCYGHVSMTPEGYTMGGAGLNCAKYMPWVVLDSIVPNICHGWCWTQSCQIYTMDGAGLNRAKYIPWMVLDSIVPNIYHGWCWTQLCQIQVSKSCLLVPLVIGVALSHKHSATTIDSFTMP
jgi:hypothetical protein